MDEMLESLPQHTCSWLQGKITMYKYQHFWTSKQLIEGAILAQQTFKADPADVFLCSAPKTGTTWLKSLAFAIATRDQFSESTSPLLTKLVHECVPFLERQVKELEENRNNNNNNNNNNESSTNLPLVATHLPYASLPESVITSDCKIVYIYRNIKDVIVSNYHYRREAFKLSMEDAPFEEAVEEFCQGISNSGPYWDHILGFWKASLERPDRILFLKYEDMKREPVSNVKRLAEFIGCPFSEEEERAGAVEKIIGLCSFENMSNLEVNKTGKPKGGSLENRLYYRKGKDGDWKNYFSDEMKEKIDELVDEKLSGTGLVLK